MAAAISFLEVEAAPADVAASRGQGRSEHWNKLAQAANNISTFVFLQQMTAKDPCDIEKGVAPSEKVAKGLSNLQKAATMPPDNTEVEVFLREASSKRLDKLSQFAVNLSTFAFLPLLLPQIWQNYLEPEKTKSLVWTGYLLGGLGNLMLCTYFTSQKEWAAVRVQAIGAISAFVVVGQIWNEGHVPSAPFFGMGIVVLLGLTITILMALGALPSKLFSLWQDATTPLGIAALRFSLASSLITETNHGVLPDWGNSVLGGLSFEAFVLAALLMAFKPPSLAPMLEKLNGWLATLLFMYMPVPQLLKHLVTPEAAMSFSLGVVYLGTLGNGLGMSRALFTKDAVWFTGSAWGALVGGSAMSASMLMANFMTWWQSSLLIAFNALFVLYLIVLFRLNGRAKGESPRQQLSFLMS